MKLSEDFTEIEVAVKRLGSGFRHDGFESQSYHLKLCDIR
jgi:hypothetical protein